jgi:GAF domain-containing protein
MHREAKATLYAEVTDRIARLIEGEGDEIAVLSTIVCELHHAFDHFDWTGFYRVTEAGVLKVGPYQGGHGCLVIPFERGVCGAAARAKRTQLVLDVTRAADHIACSSTTRSEIVVPVLDGDGEVRAVLDVDSDRLAAFDDVDRAWLELIAGLVSVTVGWRQQ